jgi:two-component system, NarL family, sensor kinase
MCFGIISKAQVNKSAFLDSLKGLPNNAAGIKYLIDLGTNYDNVDYKLALEIFKIAENKLGTDKPDTTLGIIYEKISNCYTRLYNSSEAIKYLIKVKEIGENLHRNRLITSAYSGIANVYGDNNDYERAIENLKIAVSYSKGDYPESNLYKAANLGNIGYNYYLLARSLNEHTPNYHKKYRSALLKSIYYHHLSFELPGLNKSIYWKTKDAINLCLSFIALPNLDSSMYYFQYTEATINKVNELDAKCEHEYNRGKIYEYKHDYLKAKQAYEASLAYAHKLNYQEYILENNLSLYRITKILGNYKEAIQYFATYSSNKDSVLTSKKLVEVMQLQTDYEINKKNLELQKKSNNNKILIGLFTGLCVVSFLGFKNFKNRQLVGKQKEALQAQKIIELEKDKQLFAVDAMLKGQEDERNRIAKDLHDGLGGMLSGVKISFNNLKEKIHLQAENSLQFDNSINKLDETISELRKISYNLMPEALLKFGLIDAINDFCTSTMQATQIIIAFETLGTTRELDSTAKIYIYRIVQELINNSVKHAKPSRILVQMTTAASKILITVEDNGKGMDANKMEHSKGIGIGNITHRVNYFKGNLTFENNVPHGTVVNIELNV